MKLLENFEVDLYIDFDADRDDIFKAGEKRYRWTAATAASSILKVNG